MKRRRFLNLTGLASAGLLLPKSAHSRTTDATHAVKNKPIVISTWRHGFAANQQAWNVLDAGGNALDAVERGVRVTESDANNRSVGLGGLPDRQGNVTLDACIMNHKNECGAVAFLKEIENPISVARKVMEETPHVLLVGKGAQEFALAQGFERKNLLTPGAKEAWENWKQKQEEKRPEINHENHDTIGMLALDKSGNLSGACTTSGWAYKMHGRVGDSPIIGSGLFVDNEVGAACATGLGEAVIRISGSSILVELMRQGLSPQAACEEAIHRLVRKHENLDNLQVGFLALNKNGEVGAYSVYNGFQYARTDVSANEVYDSSFQISK